MSLLMQYNGYNPYDNIAPDHYYRWADEQGISDVYSDATYNAWLQYLDTPQSTIDYNNWFPKTDVIVEDIDLPF